MPIRLVRQDATVPVVEWLESNRLSREGVAITKADCTIKKVKMLYRQLAVVYRTTRQERAIIIDEEEGLCLTMKVCSVVEALGNVEARGKLCHGVSLNLSLAGKEEDLYEDRFS